MSNTPLLSYLGLARKAGKLAVGFAASKQALVQNKAYFVAVASDISEKSEKELKFFSKGKIPVERLPYNIFEISASIGTKAGIVAVCDEGFAHAMLKLAEYKEEFTYAD